MATATFKYAIPNATRALNGNGLSLNLGSAFAATVSGKIGNITAITCSYPVMATSHRSSAKFQVTLSNTNLASSYTSNVVTKTLDSGGGYVATISNTWSTFPSATMFTDPSNTTVLIKQTASVDDIYLRYKSGSTYYVTITVTYEELTTQAYVYTTSGWTAATPYVYNGEWQEASPNIYNSGW